MFLILERFSALAKNWEDRAESSHIPNIHVPLLSTSYVSMARLLELVNQYQYFK